MSKNFVSFNLRIVKIECVGSEAHALFFNEGAENEKD